MTFSKKLIAVRKNAGHTQSEMAKLTGISRVSINHYENDVREPKLSFLRSLCEVYGVSPAWLLGLEEGLDDVMILVPGTKETENAAKMIQKAMEQCNAALNALQMTYGKPKEDT